jgi:predicted acyl esterase
MRTVVRFPLALMLAALVGSMSNGSSETKENKTLAEFVRREVMIPMRDGVRLFTPYRPTPFPLPN